MTRIIDNIDMEMGAELAAHFEASDRLDAAVGYFNLRGWRTLSDHVDKKDGQDDQPVVRLLVGMTLADPDARVHRYLQSQIDAEGDDADADRETARRRREHALHRFRSQLMRGMPNQSDLEQLRTLRQHLVEGKVAVRLFTRRPLHGKAYICHREDVATPIIGFVGSSNLTMAGLRHNYELNVDVLDGDGAKKLADWFDDRWTDKFTLDITNDLIELLNDSWIAEEPLDPYLLYLKVCYLVSQDAREGLVEYSLPESMQSQLLDFQASAVQTLARRIVHRGGAMLGDVVGLGKTITAVAVALMLREDPNHRFTTLVICPKNLVPMWQQYLDAYEIFGRVVSYSMAAKDLPKIRRHQLVIIDESHTLRTNTRQDYVAIRDYISHNDSRVLLLTATPYNKRYLDVANQLGLYIGDDENLGISPSQAISKNPRIVDLVDGKTYTLAAFRRSEEPGDWRRLMSEHLVRRTRSFIKNNYAQKDKAGKEYLTFSDGTPFYFPDRHPRPLEHDFSADHPAAEMASDETLDAIDGLLLPRYRLGEYERSGTTPTDEERDVLDDLAKASGNLIGFTRTSLYKRLSSCGHSFILSLQRHLARNDLYEYALTYDLPVPVGTLLNAMIAPDTDQPDDDDLDVSDLAQGSYDALRRRSPRRVRWVRAELFDDELVEDLRADSDAIRQLLTHFGKWEHSTDSKIDALVELLTAAHPDDKVLVFSEYKDTVDYVAQALRARGITDIAAVSGDVENPTALAHRFSPRSHSRFGQLHLDLDDELRVLVTTDVLSEGQNLQDAHVVVNYDLPWAIIRLIQRAGRVDRIGQESPEVYVYSFLPDSGVDGVLDLRQRIRTRLAENAQVFGSDEEFFGTEDETVTIEGLYTGSLPDSDIAEDDVDASSVAFEVWRAALEAHPELAERARTLPDLVDATRLTRDKETPGTVCYVRTDRGLDAFGFHPSTSNDAQLLTSLEALRRLECEPATPALPRSADHFAHVEALVRGPLERPQISAGQLRGVRLQVWRRLSGTLSSTEPEAEDALDALFRMPLTSESEGRLRSAMRARNDNDLVELLIILHRDQKLVIPDTPGSDPIRVVCSMGVARDH